MHHPKSAVLLLSVLSLLACSSTVPEVKTGTTVASVPVPQPAPSLLSGMHEVILHTSKGDITLALNADAAPKTVTNFITLAKKGYYDHLTFHRIIADFMIQGGDPLGTGQGGESIFGPTFEDEISAKSYGLDQKKLRGVTNEELPPEAKDWTLEQYYKSQGYTYNDALASIPMKRGAIAMANRGPNTNGSQFFIIQAKETPWLDGKHTVFGTVTKGLDVLDTIANVPTGAGGKPLTPVTFTVAVQE